MTSPTPFQLLRTFRDLTLETVTLGRYDTVDALEVTEKSVTLLLTVTKFTERAREDVLTRQGMKMISHSLDGSGKRREIICWDEDFVPKVARHFGSVVTEAEWYDKRDWEALCARPGDGSRFGQRDSVSREVQRVESRLDRKLSSSAALYASSQSDSEE